MFLSLPEEIIENNFIFVIPMWDIHILSQCCKKLKILCERYHHYKVFLNYIRPKNIVIGYCTLINTKKGILQIYEGEKHLLKFDIEEYNIVSMSCDDHRAFIILNEENSNQNNIYLLINGMIQKPSKIDLPNKDKQPPEEKSEPLTEKFNPLRVYGFSTKYIIKFDDGFYELEYSSGKLKNLNFENMDINTNPIFNIYQYASYLLLHTYLGFYTCDFDKVNETKFTNFWKENDRESLNYDEILDVDFCHCSPIFLTKNFIYEPHSLSLFNISHISFIINNLECSNIGMLPFKILSVCNILGTNIILTSKGIYISNTDRMCLLDNIKNKRPTYKQIKYPILINTYMKNIKSVFKNDNNLIFTAENGDIYGHGTSKSCLGKYVPYMRTKKMTLRETRIPEITFTCTKEEYEFWFCDKNRPGAGRMRKILKERGLKTIKTNTRLYEMKRMCLQYIID